MGSNVLENSDRADSYLRRRFSFFGWDISATAAVAVNAAGRMVGGGD
jgi:hypothetical protein